MKAQAIIEKHLPKEIVQELRSFSCGTDKVVTFAAWVAVKRNCAAEKYKPINSCCRAHDTCYEQQKGQEDCDNVFCDCLIEMQKKNNERKCERIVKGMCAVVKTFGEDAYKNSVKPQ
uniref:Phospholipase A2 n=1 Tax=Steinernema glaseri TaxID=37863 RepID=A0A1I7Y9M3_9BILA